MRSFPPRVLVTGLLMALVAGCSSDPRPAPTGDPTSETPNSSSRPKDQESESFDTRARHRIRSTFFGMHDGRVTGGVTPDAPVGSLRFWDSGTSWLQLELAPGQFTWGPLDTAVTTVEDLGARPLLVLGQTPTFHASKPAQEAPYGPGAASMPDLDAWQRYVTAVAERYGDRIDYQIWNEANIVQYWAGTPRQMAELTLTASRAIREVVPEATIVAPAFALRLPGQQDLFGDYWSLQSGRIDLAAAVDAVSVHLYPPATGAPEAQVGLLENAREVLADEGIDLPVWNTEINYGLLGGPEPPPIPEVQQRSFLLRTYLLNAGLGVERTYWYRWDIGRIANTYLTREDLTTETLAGRSFDLVRRWLDGTTARGCEESDGVWTCTVTAQGETRTFWWKPRGRETRVSAAGARSWTDADGETTRCGPRCRIPVSGSPVMTVSGS